VRVSLGRIPRRLAGGLRGLVIAAGTLIAVGLLFSAHTDPLSDPARIGVPWAALAPGAGGVAAAILDLGVLVLIISPAVVLAILLRSFLRWGDRQMAGLAATVIGVLGLAFFLGTR
jgi:hypothetical protein